MVRWLGSFVAFRCRLDGDDGRGYVGREKHAELLQRGQVADGGWRKRREKASDIESTYRVMRALMLLKAPPKDAKKLREFLAAHRNKDGGYATEPGKASSMSGVYYNSIIAKWLDDMGKK